MRIDILALDGVFDLGLSAVLDVFQTANELIEMSGLAVRTVRATNRRRPKSRSRRRRGSQYRSRPAGTRAPRPDCVVVPAIGFKMPGPLEAALRRPDVRDAAALLAAMGAARRHGHGGLHRDVRARRVRAARRSRARRRPGGSPRFFESAILMWLLDESNMIVKSGRFVTAGAALGHLDLALWLVRSVSPQLAALTAKYLIVDSRPSQSAYALVDHLVHDDPIVQRFESWARGRLTRGFSLDEAAKAVGASKRTLARHMQDVLGKSPLSYFQSLRVERAVHLLKTGDASVEQIAARVGYADGATLRALLRRQLNLGVKEIRKSTR